MKDNHDDILIKLKEENQECFPLDSREKINRLASKMESPLEPSIIERYEAHFLKDISDKVLIVHFMHKMENKKLQYYCYLRELITNDIKIIESQSFKNLKKLKNLNKRLDEVLQNILSFRKGVRSIEDMDEQNIARDMIEKKKNEKERLRNIKISKYKIGKGASESEEDPLHRK